jgi:hypothetical protein
LFCRFNDTAVSLGLMQSSGQIGTPLPSNGLNFIPLVGGKVPMSRTVGDFLVQRLQASSTGQKLLERRLE